jgi:predicted nucleic acid-binding protein
MKRKNGISKLKQDEIINKIKESCSITNLKEKDLVKYYTKVIHIH